MQAAGHRARQSPGQAVETHSALDFVMGSTPNDVWVNQWNGQGPNSALAPSSLALAGK
ncbi:MULTISPECIES: hypothetical protein [Burkholderia cepacia complex]|uniref:hypothetical protein n=1 Tax=Burkholderia cepacia complex TaxID=87882 RepID=UPI00157B8B8E|nr:MULTISPECIES: hypothetical protein [Burkholderia cepacia complex]